MFQKGIDNKGFSLVEVLVSMVILGLIFVPLTRNFIVAMHANNNAKEIQRATVVGQSVMEEYKEMSLNDLKMDAAKTSGDIDKKADPAVYVKEVISGSKKYKATVTVSCSNSQLDTINGKEMAKIYSMDSVSNNIYDTGVIPDWIVKNYKKTFSLSESLASIRAGMIREYHINVIKDLTTGYPQISYQTVYKMTGHSSDIYPDTESIPIVMSSDLKNIFLYYHIENGQDDEIYLSNPDGFDFNLYVIANKNSIGLISNCIKKAIIPGYVSNVASTTGVHVKSNVLIKLNGTTDIAAVANDSEYIMDKETKNRRYSLSVKIQSKDGTKDLATLNSTRGQ